MLVVNWQCFTGSTVHVVTDCVDFRLLLELDHESMLRWMAQDVL